MHPGNWIMGCLEGLIAPFRAVFDLMTKETVSKDLVLALVWALLLFMGILTLHLADLHISWALLKERFLRRSAQPLALITDGLVQMCDEASRVSSPVLEERALKQDHAMYPVLQLGHEMVSNSPPEFEPDQDYINAFHQEDVKSIIATAAVSPSVWMAPSFSFYLVNHGVASFQRQQNAFCSKCSEPGKEHLKMCDRRREPGAVIFTPGFDEFSNRSKKFVNLICNYMQPNFWNSCPDWSIRMFIGNEEEICTCLSQAAAVAYCHELMGIPWLCIVTDSHTSNNSMLKLMYGFFRDQVLPPSLPRGDKLKRLRQVKSLRRLCRSQKRTLETLKGTLDFLVSCQLVPLAYANTIANEAVHVNNKKATDPKFRDLSRRWEFSVKGLLDDLWQICSDTDPRVQQNDSAAYLSLAKEFSNARFVLFAEMKKLCSSLYEIPDIVAYFRESHEIDGQCKLETWHYEAGWPWQDFPEHETYARFMKALLCFATNTYMDESQRTSSIVYPDQFPRAFGDHAKGAPQNQGHVLLVRE